MATQNRSDLKLKFAKNAIPSQEDFANLIDSALNLVEDGVTSQGGKMAIGGDLDVDGATICKGPLKVASSNLLFTKDDYIIQPGTVDNGHASIENCKKNDALVIVGRAGAVDPMDGSRTTRVVKLWNMLHVEGNIQANTIKAANDIEADSMTARKNINASSADISGLVKCKNLAVNDLKASISLGKWRIVAEDLGGTTGPSLVFYYGSQKKVVFGTKWDHLLVYVNSTRLFPEPPYFYVNNGDYDATAGQTLLNFANFGIWDQNQNASGQFGQYWQTASFREIQGQIKDHKHTP